MTRFLAPMILALALATPASADTRNLSGFNEVNAAGKFRVEIAQGDTFSVSVTGSDAGRVVTRVQGETLRITQTDASWFRDSQRLDAIVHVTAPRYAVLSIARGGSLRGDAIAADALEINAVQGAALTLTDARVGRLEANASQGGAIEAEGACRSIDASASMGGAISADDLNCARADVSASMGGTVSVHASEFLDANASMGGAIDVSGHPARNDTSSMMGGAISIN